MAVNDHGLEVLKKAGKEITPGDKSDYYIQVAVVAGAGSSTNVNLRDENGDPYTAANPLAVQLSDGSINIGTVNANIEVQLSHTGANPDSVRLGDGITEAGVTLANELKSSDADTHTALTAANASLDAIESDADDIRIATQSIAAEDFATETTLASVLSAMDTLEGFTDQIEPKLDTLHADLVLANASLDAVEASTASIDTKASTIIGHVDGLEGLITSSNTKLDTLHTDLVAANSSLDAIEASVAAIDIDTSSIDSRLATANTTLTAIAGSVDQLEGFTDGIETLITSTNTKLDTVHTDLLVIDGHVDGLETLVTSTNTKLDTVNTNLTTIDGHVDGLETLVTSTNMKLDTLHTDVDGLETLVTSTNTKLDTVNTNLTTINGNVDGLETLVTSTNTKLDTLHADVDGLETLVGAVTETAPASDTASSGLNGRLQRIAQNITTFIAGLLRAQGSTTSGQTGPLIQGAVTTAAPAYTTGQTSPFSLNPTGALRVDPSGATSGVNVTQYGGVNTSLGQKAMAASEPVVIASDQTAVKIKNDTASTSGTGASLNADVIPSTDVSAYRAISIALSGTWVASVAFQGSNDNINFFSVAATSPTFPTFPPFAAGVVNGIYDVPIDFQYFRLRITAYTSGTVSGTAFFSTLDSSAITNHGATIYNSGGVELVYGYGTVGTSTSRTAAQLGNATGAGDFNDGVSGAQTLRVSANIMRDGTDLSYNAGTADANTPRIAKARFALNPSAPAAASVGVTNAQALASNANRTGLSLVNTSTAKISVGFGGDAAVLNSGITLYPGGSFVMTEDTFTTEAVNCIASLAASNLAIQEFAT